MRSLRNITLSATLLLVAHGVALAGTASVGANLGMNILFPNQGDGTTFTLGVPGNVGQVLPGFMPGFRVAVTDDSGANTLLIEPGVYMLSFSSETLTQFEGLVGYQRQFSPSNPSSGFVNVEVGALVQNYASESFTNLVAGVGLGVRHRLAHGHGGSRFEVRIDVINEDREGFVGGTLGSLRVGFDLDTK